MSERGRYYQTITRIFLEHRGAPFFLSAKEIDTIASWEKEGIPLRVVLNGIRDSFLNQRARSGRKGKFFSLAFCDKHVMDAFSQHKERKVGQKKRTGARENRQERILSEVERFLASIPSSWSDLKEAYSSVQNILSCKSLKERSLEDWEEKIEDLIYKVASSGEKDRIKKEAFEEYNISDGEELNRISKIKLIGYLRNKHKIPHVSPFYY